MRSDRPPSIGCFETVPGYGGGNIYKTRILEAIQAEFEVILFKVHPGKGRGKRLKMIKRIQEIQRREKDIDAWVRTDLAVTAMQFSRPRGVNIGLFYHLDSSYIPHRLLSRIFDNLFMRNLRKCDPVVVISNYWKEFLQRRGFNNVVTIHFGLNPEVANIREEEVKSFLNKYGFDAGCPLIYLGNCKRGKGVVGAYEALRDEGYQLVTSGKPDVKLSIPNLDLNYREYLTLLKASSVVVAMSLFLEGWNITVHEAMLCGTPVVGSGKGGMSELLEGGEQIICENFDNLSEAIQSALDDHHELGAKARNYAMKYDYDRFKNCWVNILLDAVCNNECRAL